ncbi:MAG TPA: hypothetical protein VHW94_01085 [Candidatus Dormibacteraeota bacterium]|jgi:hypothetical protein|nr:hypothetical protein [Candidatus Dormibacteraeota bacterium]
MPKRPGHVNVTTEVGYCPFCNRSRNLRSEGHVMGALMRTTITCETCHRTLSSTMGPAQAAEPAEQAGSSEDLAERAAGLAEDLPSAPARAASAKGRAADADRVKQAPRKPRAAKPAAGAARATPKPAGTRRSTKA